jgi:hypothetical protein
MSEEQKMKLSEAHKNKKVLCETRKKISKKLSKKTIQMNLNGDIAKIYSSTKEAYLITGIRHIVECCNGNRKTAGGYVWKYD